MAWAALAGVYPNAAGEGIGLGHCFALAELLRPAAAGGGAGGGGGGGGGGGVA